MELGFFIDGLSRNRGVIEALAAGVSNDRARWKPSSNQWSVLEVVNHLGDEEVEDFRRRLDLLLHQPDKPWPPIDPRGACIARRYNERDIGESIAGFSEERRRSIAWLEGLGELDWGRTYRHPQIGILRAGDLLLSWLVHDFIHIRQINRLHYAYSMVIGRPFDAEYAGGFGESATGSFVDRARQEPKP